MENSLAALAARAMGSLIFGVSPLDPATYAIAGLLTLAIAAITAVIPARIASDARPAEVLRDS